MQLINECVDRLRAEGWTIGKIAADLGMSADNLRLLRKGETAGPRFDTVAQLCLRARISIDQKLGLVPLTETPRPSDVVILERLGVVEQMLDRVHRTTAETGRVVSAGILKELTSERPAANDQRSLLASMIEKSNAAMEKIELEAEEEDRRRREQQTDLNT